MKQLDSAKFVANHWTLLWTLKLILKYSIQYVTIALKMYQQESKIPATAGKATTAGPETKGTPQQQKERNKH